MDNLFPTIRSLSNMISEMNSKKLEIKRITKTSSLLLLSGLTPNSIPDEIVHRVLSEQQKDGGWVSVVDTMWNSFFLSLFNREKYYTEISNGKTFLFNNKNKFGLWGRSKRDMSRIPVSGILLYLFPDLNTDGEIFKLEKLWESEINSLVYKAGYSLMALKKNDYTPDDNKLIRITCEWLVQSQRKDGGFAPWFDHPVDSDIFCTSVAVLGLLQYPEYVNTNVYQDSFDWIINNRLKSGIWKYHEIEDGASWGLFALSELKKRLK